MRFPDALSPLRERRFRLFFGAQATSVLGDNLAPVAIAFAVIGLGGSALEIGIVLAARSLPTVLLVVPAGVIADRFGRRRVLLASDLVSFTSQAALAAILIAGDALLWQVILFQALYGTAAAFFLPAASGLVPETVSPGRLQQAYALVWSATGTAGVLGPALAGILVATVGPGWAVAADAATFAVSASLLSRLRGVDLRPATASPTLVSELVLGWREVRSRSWIWASIADFAAFHFFVFGTFFVLGPIVAENDLGGASGWATVVTAFGVGSVLGSILAFRVRPARPLVAAFAGSLLFVPALALLAAPAPLVALTAAWALAGAALGFGGVLWETTLQERIPPEMRSRVSAYDWLGSLAMRPLAFVLVGPLAEAVGVDVTLWLAAAALAACTSAVLAVPGVRRVERLEEPRSEPPPGQPRLAVDGDQGP